MNTDDLGQLRRLAMFALVVEMESFSAVATRLATSRSRVSEQISTLERALGVRLMHRSTRQLALTAEGKRVYQHASRLRGVLEQVIAETDQQVLRGRVRLTSTHDIGVRRLAPHLVTFEQAYPEVQLDLVLSDERLDIIAEEIDVGVRIGLPSDDSLIARELFEERPLLMASPGYLERAGRPADAAALEQHRWILLQQISEHGSLRLYNAEHNAEHNAERDSQTNGEAQCVVRPQRYHVVSAALMAHEMVVCGMGLSLLLPATVREYLDAGELEVVLPQWRGLPRIFALVYPSRRQVPLRTRCLIDHLLGASIFS